MLFPKSKGEIIDKETLIARIHEAVRCRVEEDVQDAIDLHNFLCGGQVQVNEDTNGEPVGKDCKVIDSHEGTSAWTYVFTNDE